MPAIAVTKCQGTGNDFVLLDNRTNRSYPYAELAREICDRRLGIGADGLLVLLPARLGADVAMRIFNADGGEAEMCGNGIRCVARYIARESSERALAIETAAGVVRTEPAPGGMVRVNMGVPSIARPFEVSFDFAGRTYRAARVSMGNPHAVVFFDKPIDNVALEELAPALAKALGIASLGVNVEIVFASANKLRMRVSERGVGETWACGTGACAAAVAAILTGRAASPVEVVARGGAVSVAWEGAGTPAFLTGPADIVFDTEFEAPAQMAAAAE